MDVRVHQMCVEEVRAATAYRRYDCGGHPGVQIRRAPNLREGNPKIRELHVKSSRIGSRCVETEETCVDAPLTKCGKERQQMPFGAADPGELVEVHHLHDTASSLR